MRKPLAVALAALALVIGSCSQAPEPVEDAGTVYIMGRLESNSGSVSLVAGGGKGASSLLAKGETVDSLRINKFRLLISRVKMHRSEADSMSGDRDFSLDPVVVQVDSGKLSIAVASRIPPALYDKVKFEFHKFSASEGDFYRNDPFYKDFIEGNERYSSVFEGVVYKDGQSSPFKFRSDATANLSLKLDPALDLKKDSTDIIFFELSPRPVFMEDGQVLDPRDEKNRPHINNMIKDAIRALKN